MRNNTKEKQTFQVSNISMEIEAAGKKHSTIALHFMAMNRIQYPQTVGNSLQPSRCGATEESYTEMEIHSFTSNQTMN